MNYNKETLYFGTTTPLDGETFSKDKINPFGINNEGSGVCFTTSPQEAYEVYATPPYSDDALPSDLTLNEAYKSEWYNKTFAINENNGGGYDNLTKLREDFVATAAPTIYQCTAEIYNPFVVSAEQPITSSIEFDGSDFYSEDMTKQLLQKYYPDKSPIDIGKYEHSLALLMFKSLKDKNSDITMTDCKEDAHTILQNFSKMIKRKPAKANTLEFYNRISSELADRGIKGKHNEVIGYSHDSIVIENVGEMYANARYGNNKHVMAFDVNKIHFKVSNTQNIDTPTPPKRKKSRKI